MNVSQPIRSVVPSLDGPVLGALAAAREPARLSDIHRRAGVGSLSGVRKVLERLVHHGLVNHVAGGYLLNRQHLAAGAIVNLANLHAGLVQRLRDWLGAWEGDVHAAALYGSAARRDGDAESDVDVLVVTNSPHADVLRDDLSALIRTWTGNPAQVLVRTTQDLAEMHSQGSPLLESWRRDLQMLIGRRRDVVS